MSSVGAFAVRRHDRLIVETVSPTERACKVSGLVVVFGIVPKQHWTDADINMVWNAALQKGDVEIVPVTVTYAP